MGSQFTLFAGPRQGVGREKRCPSYDCAYRHVHLPSNVATEGGSLGSAPITKLPQAPVARKRPSERRNSASTSETLAHSTGKRKRSTHSGSSSNAGHDPAPLRKKRLASVIESGTSGDGEGDERLAFHGATPSNEMGIPSTEELPPHPPLEEIEMWVPTPDAKFGPPKRNRAAGERGHLLRERRTEVHVSAVISAQPSVPRPSLRRPLALSESQIVALREEEESQSPPPELPPTPNRSGSPAQQAVPTDPPQPSAEDATGLTKVPKVTSQESAGQSTSRPAVDIQFTNGSANTERVLKHDRDIHYSQPDATNTSFQGKTIEIKSSLPPSAPAPQSRVNSNAVAIAASPPESPQGEPAFSDPRSVAKSSASSAEQLSHSRIEPLQRGSGTLAERRAFEARVRLDELRRAAARFSGDATKGRISAWKTFQAAEQPPPHVMLQQVMSGLESPNQPQVTAPGNPETEIFARASASGVGGRETHLSASFGEDLIHKSDQKDDFGRLLQQDGVVVTNVPLVRDNGVTRTVALC
jgi:hypothetical protein